MRRFSHPLLVFLLAGIIVACSEDDPLPRPDVGFEVETPVPEIGRPVMFHNLTTNASSYQWTFGDGQTSTEINPQIIYDEPGEYWVSLTATTDDNQQVKDSIEIEVGERLLTGIGINSIAFVDDEGNYWDDNTGLDDSVKYPDVDIFLVEEDVPENGIATPIIVDMGPRQIPTGFTIDPGAFRLAFTDADWLLIVEDYDGDTPEDPAPEDFVTMNGIRFNPVQFGTFFVDPDTGDGVIRTTFGSYSIDLFFTVEVP